MPNAPPYQSYRNPGHLVYFRRRNSVFCRLPVRRNVRIIRVLLQMLTAFPLAQKTKISPDDQHPDANRTEYSPLPLSVIGNQLLSTSAFTNSILSSLASILATIVNSMQHLSHSLKISHSQSITCPCDLLGSSQFHHACLQPTLGTCSINSGRMTTIVGRYRPAYIRRNPDTHPSRRIEQ